MNRSLLLIFVIIESTYNIYGQQATSASTNLNGLINMFSNGKNGEGTKPLTVSELTKKAASEFDKLSRQLEGVLTQLTASGPFKMTHLDPSVVNNDCKCYCMCPRDMVNSKVMEDIKAKVTDFKDRFFKVGQTIKEKIHELTSR